MGSRDHSATPKTPHLSWATHPNEKQTVLVPWARAARAACRQGMAAALCCPGQGLQHRAGGRVLKCRPPLPGFAPLPSVLALLQGRRSYALLPISIEVPLSAAWTRQLPPLLLASVPLLPQPARLPRLLLLTMPAERPAACRLPAPPAVRLASTPTWRQACAGAARVCRAPLWQLESAAGRALGVRRQQLVYVAHLPARVRDALPGQRVLARQQQPDVAAKVNCSTGRL